MSSVTKKPSGRKPEAKSNSSVKKAPLPVKLPPVASAPDAPISAMAESVLKKQELIDKVVRLSGIKKKDAKLVVEAMLEVMGEALADGREFNLQPLGKLKLNRTKETPGARIIVAKIRQSKGMGGATKDASGPVAAAAE